MGDKKVKRRKPRSMRHERQLNVAVTETQWGEVKREARAADLTVAEFVRRAIATACNSPTLPKL